jgi:hypothetical protein
MDDLDDDVTDVFGAPLTPIQRETSERTAVAFTPTGFEEPCKGCKGRGRFISYSGRDCGQCYKCKGKGKLTFKSSPEARAQGRQRVEAKKVAAAKTVADQVAAWAEANPDAYAWLISRCATFDFARSLLDALIKYGHLTTGQMASVAKCLASDAARAEERAKVVAAAPTVEIAAIEEAFTSALNHSIKRPKLRLDTFNLALASATGTNAGAIYVKQGDDYLGKIKDGRFVRVRACDDATEARVIEACSDPKAAAIAYGKREGACSCCGRALSNHASIDLGIGPICAEKWGW